MIDAVLGGPTSLSLTPAAQRKTLSASKASKRLRQWFRDWERSLTEREFAVIGRAASRLRDASIEEFERVLTGQTDSKVFWARVATVGRPHSRLWKDVALRYLATGVIP
jgi:hypothetical protein